MTGVAGLDEDVVDETRKSRIADQSQVKGLALAIPVRVTNRDHLMVAKRLEDRGPGIERHRGPASRLGTNQDGGRRQEQKHQQV